MKLASYADGSRDGHLVVVSRDLSQAHFATGIATRLQQVLDDWGFLAPQLETLAIQLNQGQLRHAFDFNPAQCMAPLPRALGWAMVAGDAVQHGPGDFLGPTEAQVARAGAAPTAHPHLALICGDLPGGSDAASARDALRLVSLALDWRLGGNSLATQFAPVAVTPDELGPAQPWDARAVVRHNGQPLATQDLRSLPLSPGDALARMARLRRLRAGQVVGVAWGALDVALSPGDHLHWALRTADGASACGAIDLDLEIPA